MAEILAAHARHFRKQAEWCERLGSPFNAALLRGLADRFGEGHVLDELLATGARPLSPDGADAGPLRIAGALHGLVLAGRDSALEAQYPARNRNWDMAVVVAVALEAVARHRDWVADFITRPPQTNETRRAIGFLPGLEGLKGPLHLLEIGASAGLNQHWEAFGYDGGHWSREGSDGAPLVETKWTGRPPDLPDRIEIASRRACDLTPLDIRDDFHRLRLKSYIWPDQSDRLDRLDKAVAVALERGVEVERSNAADWLEDVLSAPLPEGTSVIYHSIAWQYFDTDTNRRAMVAIERAGARADDAHRLVWLRYEHTKVFNPEGSSLRHELDRISWPGSVHQRLAEVDPHGLFVKRIGA